MKKKETILLKLMPVQVIMTTSGSLNHSNEQIQQAQNILDGFVDMILEYSMHPELHGDQIFMAATQSSSHEKVEPSSPRF